MNDLISVLYEDESLLVVNKPVGILVHRSQDTSLREPAVLQIMRDRVGQRLYPVHRLDRPTSGVLVFAKSSEAASQLGQQLAQHLFQKTYLAIVRGWAPVQLNIDHPLKDLDDVSGPAQNAGTALRRLNQVELPVEVDRYPKTRYSLVLLQPKTGRRHQLRRHCKSIFHPILGDTIYGPAIHNRFIRQEFSVHRLLLHHQELTLQHPADQRLVSFKAPLDEDWQKMLKVFAWDSSVLGMNL